MRLIDRYAYNNRLTKVNPASKAGLVLLVIVLCLGLNRPIVGVVAVGWMAVLAIFVAGVPGGVFGRILLAESSFLLLTSIGIALSVSVTPSPQPWQWQIGAFTFSSSPESLRQMVLLVTRAMGAAAALNFLALTTPLVDIVGLLRRMRFPETLIDIMVVMYRFIFVLLETLEQMVTAQSARLGFQGGYWRSMKNTGQLGARLFINAMSRASRLETAISARGFDGSLQVIMPQYRAFPRFAVWLGGIVVSLILARLISFG